MSSQTNIGMWLAGGILAFIFIWGSIARVAGAVIAQGRITLESSVKRVQHREGGIVGSIFVKEGDLVQIGQVLIQLDSTIAGANALTVTSQIEQLTARKLRLEAERDGKSNILKPNLNSPIIDAEQRLLTSRLSSTTQRKAQIDDQVRQAGFEIGGYEAQISSIEQQAYFARKELKSVSDVFKQGYGSFTRVSELERQMAQFEGQSGQLSSAIAKSRAQISQLQQAKTQIDSELLTETMTQLKDADTKLAELRQQEITTRDAQDRLEVRAPATGKVQQLMVHTRGGVVASGETIMLIVPDADELIVEANIDPANIDSVIEGGSAHLRFVAFQTQTTPETEATIDRVSRDIETDQRTGVSFYRARLKLDSKKIPVKMRGKLQPGQPVEVHVSTSNRSALSYFLKPLSDQIARTFREE